MTTTAGRRGTEMNNTRTGGTTARDKAIDAGMRGLYGSYGPDPDSDIDVQAVRRILGAVFDAGAKAKSAR